MGFAALCLLTASACEVQPGCDPDLECAAEGTGTESSTTSSSTETETGDETETETGTDTDTESDTDTEPSPDCIDGGVFNGLELDTTAELPIGEGIWDCYVLDIVTEVTTLECFELDDPMGNVVEIDLDLFTSQAGPSIAMPFALDEQIELRTYYDDFPPFFLSVIARDETGDLRLARIAGFSTVPFGASDDWSLPFTSVTLEPSDCTIETNTRQYVVVDGPGLAEPVRVLESYGGVLPDADGDFVLRVTQASKDPEIVGGCNTCVRYLIAPAG